MIPKKKQKPKTEARPQSIILTSMQAALVDATLQGKDPIAAAAQAGYANPVGSAKHVIKSEAVQLALKEARSELSSAAQITRADVIDGFMEAINVARLAADPTAMIKGWSETAKVLGLYAPEIKKIDLSMNHQRLQGKFQVMSDAELVEIIEGRVQLAIEGESERVA